MELLRLCSPQKQQPEYTEKMIAVMAWHLGMSKAAIFFYALMWLLIEIQRVLLRIAAVLRSLRNGKPDKECSSPGEEPGLPVCRFEKLQGRERVEEKCSICLMEFEGEDEVSELGRCGHVFHKECIEKWVEKSRFTCPLCRAFFFDAETWQAKWGLALPDSSSSLYYFLQ